MANTKTCRKPYCDCYLAMVHPDTYANMTHAPSCPVVMGELVKQLVSTLLSVKGNLKEEELKSVEKMLDNAPDWSK